MNPTEPQPPPQAEPVAPGDLPDGPGRIELAAAVGTSRRIVTELLLFGIDPESCLEEEP